MAITSNNNNEPFAYGDGTLMQLRDQHWDFDELGTMMVTPIREVTPDPAAVVPAAEAVPEAQAVFGEETKLLPTVFGDETKLLPTAAAPAIAAAPAMATATVAVEAVASGDPLARIEQRLEELTRAVLSMQRRLDSIDQAMARFLTR